jgi:hypothetical protein
MREKNETGGREGIHIPFSAVSALLCVLCVEKVGE